MPHDPEVAAETRAWLTKATLDLRAAAHEFTATPPLVDDIVFHAQQAAEKAFLTWQQATFRKTHNLEEIGEQCLAFDSSPKAIIDRAVPLTEYAWRFRYPGETETVDEPEARQALKTDAQDVYDAVLARLPDAVHPPSLLSLADRRSNEDEAPGDCVGNDDDTDSGG
ncbi:MAG: HEPN domain-containing protein [Vicinamibacteraceae bacterium]